MTVLKVRARRRTKAEMAIARAAEALVPKKPRARRRTKAEMIAARAGQPAPVVVSKTKPVKEWPYPIVENSERIEMAKKCHKAHLLSFVPWADLSPATREEFCRDADKLMQK